MTTATEKKPGTWFSRFLKSFGKRGPMENRSIFLIGLGVFMLMQPFHIVLYTYSFITILIGTVGFVIVSHFPE